MYCTEEYSLKQIDFAVKDVGKLMCGRRGKVPVSPPQLPQNPSGPSCSEWILLLGCLGFRDRVSFSLQRMWMTLSIIITQTVSCCSSGAKELSLLLDYWPTEMTLVWGTGKDQSCDL